MLHSLSGCDAGKNLLQMPRGTRVRWKATSKLITFLSWGSSKHCLLSFSVFCEQGKDLDLQQLYRMILPSRNYQFSCTITDHAMFRFGSCNFAPSWHASSNTKWALEKKKNKTYQIRKKLGYVVHFFFFLKKLVHPGSISRLGMGVHLPWFISGFLTLFVQWSTKRCPWWFRQS